MSTNNLGQRFLKKIVSRNYFDSLKTGTQEHMLVCPCGHKTDLWQSGGLMYKGNEKKTLSNCNICKKRTWHLKRKKDLTELEEFYVNNRRERTFLSSHAWYVSLIIWSAAVVIWTIPLVQLKEPHDNYLVYLGSLLLSQIIAWFILSFWFTTRYKITNRYLIAYSGPFKIKMELKKITEVSNKRKTTGISMALGQNYLWVGYPIFLGGVLISPNYQEIFLNCLSLEEPDIKIQRI